MDTTTSRFDYNWKGPYTCKFNPVKPPDHDPILSDGSPAQMSKRKMQNYILAVDKRYRPPEKNLCDQLLLYPGHIEYMPSKCRVSTYQFDFCKEMEAVAKKSDPKFPEEWCRGESEYRFAYFSPEMRCALFSNPRLPPFKTTSEYEREYRQTVGESKTGVSMYEAVHSALGCDLLTKMYNCCENPSQ